MNLILDSWIPVLRNGQIVAIRPDQIGDPGVCQLAWPRADFNLACLELLIGLVSIADAPRGDAEWLTRLERPDADRLREALRPFAPCFALAGDGPRFLQDREAFECAVKRSDIKPIDMLYIDSAGDKTTRDNADLTVKRGRYASLPPAEAAMALYTLQAFAPSGGQGNRTSMRGGGPMTTLVQPVDDEDEKYSLWRLVYANVSPGLPLAAENAEDALPWLRPTRTSKEDHQIVIPEHAHRLEAFFGMPRRLRLLFENGRAVGVVQRPYGTNYKAWQHPLTPYYRRKEDDPEWLPVPPKAGRLSYRNWLGVTMQASGDDKGGTRRMAETVRAYQNHPRSPDCELMVGGWTMNKMKPVDFSLHKYPGFRGLSEHGADRVHQLVEAANTVADALRKALKTACQLDGKSVAVEAAVETFFAETEESFQESVGRIIEAEGKQVEEKWHQTLRNQALRLFNERSLDGLADHAVTAIEKRMTALRILRGVLARKVRKGMDLPLPDKQERRT